MNKSSCEEYKRSYYGWVVVGFTFLAQLIAFGLVYSFAVFFKPLASEFNWSRAATTGPFFAYAIIHDVLAPVTGRITDRFGPKAVAALGGLCLGLAMILMSHVTSIWQVYIVYGILFSIGIASIYGPQMATVSRWFVEKRGFAVGITAMGLGAGSLVFSPLAAWLISSYGWETAYIVVGIICWVIFIPIVRFIRKAPLITVEVEQKREAAKDFTAAEAVKTRAFWMISFSWLFLAIAYWAVAINIVPLLTDRGISLVSAGAVAGAIGGASMVSRVGMGFLSDRIGRERGLVISVVVQLGGAILLLFCQDLWLFFLFAIIFGLGMGGWAGIVPSLPADFFGLKATATIFGFIVIFAGIGVGLGPFFGGRIFDITGSYYYMIWMCIITLIISLILALFIKSPEKSQITC